MVGVLDGIEAILSPGGNWAWAELGKKTFHYLTLCAGGWGRS